MFYVSFYVHACRYLYLFGFSVANFAIGLSTVAVGFAFIFGNSLREVYESLVWLFGVNPYDAGAPTPFTSIFRFLETVPSPYQSAVRFIPFVFSLPHRPADSSKQYMSGFYLSST